MSRLFAIPDIHGRLDLLDKLVRELNLRPDDTVVFLGDYVDRGPDSRGVIKFLRQLQIDRPAGNTICLAGNHEWLAIRGARGAHDPHGEAMSMYHWMVNGGGSTVNSYRGHEEDFPGDMRWLAALPLCHEEPEFFFSHAPVPFGVVEPYSPEILTWTHFSRQEEGKVEAHHKDRVGVCGHIHRGHKVKAPRFYKHYIYCDCGCGCWGSAPLVAVEVQTREVIYAWPSKAGVTVS